MLAKISDRSRHHTIWIHTYSLLTAAWMVMASACTPPSQVGAKAVLEPTQPATLALPDDGSLRLLELINDARAKKRIHTLSLDPRLILAASDHSDSMFHHQYFAHRGRGERDFQKRLLYRGYPRSSSAENIAMAPDPNQVYHLWLNSPGHRKNMLHKNYTRIGIARSGNYWTADFAAPDGE